MLDVKTKDNEKEFLMAQHVFQIQKTGDSIYKLILAIVARRNMMKEILS